MYNHNYIVSTPYPGTGVTFHQDFTSHITHTHTHTNKHTNTRHLPPTQQITIHHPSIVKQTNTKCTRVHIHMQMTVTTYPGIPPDSMWLARETSFDHTSNCHLFTPSTPDRTWPVCTPTRMLISAPVARRTSLQDIFLNDYMTLTHTLENFPLYTVNFKAIKTVPNYIASLKAIAIYEENSNSLHVVHLKRGLITTTLIQTRLEIIDFQFHISLLRHI